MTQVLSIFSLLKLKMQVQKEIQFHKTDLKI